MRPLPLLQATAFVSTFDRFAMAPLLVAIAHDLDAPLASVVSAAGVYFLAYGLMQPVWGIVAGRLGLVRSMRVALLLAGAFSTASALSPSVVTLGLLRAVAGAAFAAAYPGCLIYLGDTVPFAQRQPQIAKLMVGIALGTAAASVGAGALGATLGWRVVFVLTGVATLVMAVVLRRLPEPVVSRGGAGFGRSLRRIVTTPVAVAVLCLAFLEGAALLGALTLVPAALEHAGADTAVAGLVAGLYGASVLVFATVVSRVAGRIAPAALIAVGAVSAFGAAVLLALTQQVVAGGVAAALLGVAWTAMHSSLQTWATDVIPSERALLVSLFAGFLFCGSAIAAVTVSGLADAGRYSVIFGATAVVCVLLGVAATNLRSRWRPCASTP